LKIATIFEDALPPVRITLSSSSIAQECLGQR